MDAGHGVVTEDPRGQKVECTHVVGAETPAAHIEPAGQVVGAVVPAAQKLDAGQSTCKDGLAQYFVAEHVVCAVDPGAQYIPGLHASCNNVLAHTEPRAHSAWDDELAGQKYPKEQVVGIPYTQKLPAAHGTDAVDPVGQLVPLAHCVLVDGLEQANPATHSAWAVVLGAQ